jgi:hypothetical protein
MKKVLLEDIKRITSLMYGGKKIILERFSKEIKSYFEQNDFWKGVFPHSGGYTNEFFRPIKSTYEKSTDIHMFQFMLQTENPQYDLDGWDMNTYIGTNKARALVVAKDPLSTDVNLKVQRNPTNWETYVFLSKWNYNQSTANMVQKQYPNLQFSEECLADNKQVFCLTGTMTKEQVVQVANYLEEANWAKLDIANPEKTNVT